MPASGSYAVNNANGNLLVQNADVQIHEPGIDLVYTRTYNSLSQHDTNNTDKSIPSAYGEGWTSTYDAHIAYNGSNEIVVYDSAGTSYMYYADGKGNWVPPTGTYASLVYDNQCGYEWTQRDGTVYYFYSPDLNSNAQCSQAYPQNVAYGGRLYKIWSRNHNNNITLTYSWLNGNASTSANLSQILVTHSSGHTLTLSFGSGTSGGPPELLSVKAPDNNLINYYYDSTTGTLLQKVVLPPAVSGYHTIVYGYSAAVQPHLLSYVESPRYVSAVNAGRKLTHFVVGSPV